MLSTVWDEITYPFPNFKGANVEIWARLSNFIPHFTGHYISMLWLKFIHVSKKAPQVLSELMPVIQMFQHGHKVQWKGTLSLSHPHQVSIRTLSMNSQGGESTAWKPIRVIAHNLYGCRYHTEACTKWSPFRRRHFELYFVNENECIFIQILVQLVLYGKSVDQPSIFWGNVPNKRQAIT